MDDSGSYDELADRVRTKSLREKGKEIENDITKLIWDIIFPSKLSNHETEKNIPKKRKREDVVPKKSRGSCSEDEEER